MAMLPPPPPTIKLLKRTAGAGLNVPQVENEGPKPKQQYSPPVLDDPFPGLASGSLSPVSPEPVSPEPFLLMPDSPASPDATVVFESDDNGYSTSNFEHMVDLIRPPSPSVIEVAVPPKPPPVVVDLLEDDPVKDKEVRQIKHGPAVVLPETLKQILAKHSASFPGHSLPQVDEIEWLCHDILMEYQIDELKSHPPYGSIPLKIMMINYYKHIYKNRSQFDDYIIRIKRDEYNPDRHIVRKEYKDWAVKNKWNDRVEDYLGPSSKQVLTLKLLMEGKTELQTILHDTFSSAVKNLNADYFWQQKWSPVNLTMGFRLFITTASNTIGFRSTDNSLLRQNILKHWYIEYMAEVAESRAELLLAIISAFGVTIRDYPGRLLELLATRNIIHAGCQLRDEPLIISDKNRGEDDKIPEQNAFQAMVLRTEYDRTEPTDLNPISLLERKYDLSLAKFAPVARKMWSTFYGKDKIIPEKSLKDWYHKLYYTDELLLKLNQALSKALNDNRLPRLCIVKQISEDDKEEWLKAILPEKERRTIKAMSVNPGLQLKDKPTVQALMESETSLLQLSLQNSPNRIPTKDAWNPTGIRLPYELFKTLFRIQVLMLTKSKCKLPGTSLKVRYIEFMWDYYKDDTSKLLLAVFSALGPNFRHFPLRVIYILQMAKILRDDIGLPKCDSFQPSEVFKPLDQNFSRVRHVPQPRQPPRDQTPVVTLTSSSSTTASTSASIPPLLPPRKPAKTVPLNPKKRITRSMTASASPATATPAVAVPTPAVVPPSLNVSTQNFGKWKATACEALKMCDLPGLTEIGLQETYSRHTSYRQSMDSSQDSEFMKGMLAGISLAMKSYEEQRVQPRRSYPSATLAPPVVTATRIDSTQTNLPQPLVLTGQNSVPQDPRLQDNSNIYQNFLAALNPLTPSPPFGTFVNRYEFPVQQFTNNFEHIQVYLPPQVALSPPQGNDLPPLHPSPVSQNPKKL